MKLVTKVNIRFKLAILFLILCISIAILGYKSIDISEQNKTVLKEVESKSQIVVSLQKNIITPLYSLREVTQSLVMAPNKEIRGKIEQNLNKLVLKLDREFEKLDGFQKQTLMMWDNYKHLINNIKQDLKEEFEEGAYINVTTSSRTQFHLLVNQLLEVQNRYLNNTTIAYNEAVEDSKEVKIEILIYLAIILLFATIIGWMVANNIVSSIHKVQNGLKEFFNYLNRKTNNIEKIEIHSKDEFYQMVKIINQNVTTIKNDMEQNEALIKNATKVLEDIKGGNLKARLTQKTNNKSLSELKNMINNMINNLEHKIQEQIGKRVEQEQLLIQQSKLASMGEMIGNIAHQWRQPLAQISAIHMNMKVTYDFDNFTKEYMKEKMDEAKKLTSYMSQTISDFQNFFKPQGEKEKFSVQKACEEAYLILESSLKYYNIEVKFDIKENSLVYGYKNEYSQVILNVLSNAKDVLLDRKIKNPEISIEIKSGDNFAIVKIEDNAGGVPEKIISNIFDPYFTTKHKKQGTGIGLYMSKNIIERNMSGFINVKNTYSGAVFTIKISKSSK